MPSQAAALRSAAVGPDLAALGHLAHMLKGTAGGYGFTSITNVAGELERAVLSGKSSVELGQRVDDLANLCARARARAA
jgi:HPt (histidine-containing phosphotransfer) domain-containing protein